MQDLKDQDDVLLFLSDGVIIKYEFSNQVVNELSHNKCRFYQKD